jgi:hypothetical protein
MSFKNLTTQELVDLINNYVSEVRKLEFQVHRTQATIQELEALLSERTSGETDFITIPVASAAEPAKPKKRRGRPPKKKTETTEAGAQPKKRRGRPPKKKTEEVEAAATPKKRRGRPPKKKTETTEAGAQPKKRRGRPPKKKTEERAQPEPTIADEGKGYRLSEWDLFIIENLEKAQHVLVNAQILELAKAKVEEEKLDLNDQQLRGKLNRSIHKLANKRGNLVKVDYPGKGFAYGLPNWTDKNNEIKKKYLKG